MIPKEFSEFYKILERLALRYDFSDVFTTMLTILVNFFSDGAYTSQRDKYVKRFFDDDKTLFNSAFNEFFKAFESYFNNHSENWFDVLGSIYEDFSSRKKSQALGQFFTPPHICDFMASITLLNYEGTGNILEPAAGSGRMILAAHAIAPHYKFAAIDTDYICYLMTAVNMYLHGAQGFIYWGDALSNAPAHEALEITTHHVLNIPFIQIANPDLKPNYIQKLEPEPTIQPSVEPLKHEPKDDGKGYIQLSLF